MQANVIEVNILMQKAAPLVYVSKWVLGKKPKADAKLSGTRSRRTKALIWGKLNLETKMIFWYRIHCCIIVICVIYF